MLKNTETGDWGVEVCFVPSVTWAFSGNREMAGVVDDVDCQVAPASEQAELFEQMVIGKDSSSHQAKGEMAKWVKKNPP